MMKDHLGRRALQGKYLAQNKERIEREGKIWGGPYGICDITGEEHSSGDVCKHWENSSLSNLIG